MFYIVILYYPQFRFPWFSYLWSTGSENIKWKTSEISLKLLFIVIHCYSCCSVLLIVIIVNFWLCLIYKLYYRCIYRGKKNIEEKETDRQRQRLILSVASSMYWRSWNKQRGRTSMKEDTPLNLFILRVIVPTDVN